MKRTINLKPMPSPRPRFQKVGTYTRAYMDKGYQKWKRDFLNVLLSFGDTPIKQHQPIHVDITFYIEPPKSFSKVKKNQEGLYLEVHPVAKKPDIDNLIKSVLDSLNGSAWHDDGQITDISSRKRYSDNPRIEILVKPID